ncbi:hypothetical protein GQ600_20148 [Phytophthora cactorum]|nr:hypothetical protein GQ600_20148 [Phytophthora cactorum]
MSGPVGCSLSSVDGPSSTCSAPGSPATETDFQHFNQIRSFACCSTAFLHLSRALPSLLEVESRLRTMRQLRLLCSPQPCEC